MIIYIMKYYFLLDGLFKLGIQLCFQDRKIQNENYLI